MNKECMDLKIYCAEHGHDWVIKDTGFWDKAICLTCNAKIRNIRLFYRDLPNPRKSNNSKNQ